MLNKDKVKQKLKKNKYLKSLGESDAILFNTILVMLCFGLIMCFSASAPSAEVYQGDSYFFLKKQILWAVVGLVAMSITSNIDMGWIKKNTGIAYIVTAVMLGLTLLMPAWNGARRWLGVGSARFQPSEIAKIVLILCLAKRLEKQKWEKAKYFEDFVPYLFVIGLICGLIILEPHYSCTILILIVSCGMLFFSGAKLRHFFITAIPLIPVLVYLIFSKGYRSDRIEAFLHPFDHPLDGAWQTIQSLYAIGSGGLFGLGLGESRQKFLYLPEAQNDFIFAIICEELGFVGALAVILLFVILLWRCIVIAINSKDKYSCLVVLGITTLIASQFILNIAVVTNLVPVTGMPLPFFSAGGTSLVFVLAAMGFVLNISKK